MEPQQFIAAKEFADWMREERERRGWSTTELARRARDIAIRSGSTLALTQQSISNVENYKQKRVPEWARFVAEAFTNEIANKTIYPSFGSSVSVASYSPALPGPSSQGLFNLGTKTADAPGADIGGYVVVDVMPTFAGMGGGGTGEGDPGGQLVPRQLIEGELRGKAPDFLFIDVRGDSMEPDFKQGDQLLIDKRSRSPAQPGPFLIRDEGWLSVKNVEFVRDGIRIFSSNPKYSDKVVTSDDIRVEIIGRPVWYGRRI